MRGKPSRAHPCRSIIGIRKCKAAATVREHMSVTLHAIMSLPSTQYLLKHATRKATPPMTELQLHVNLLPPPNTGLEGGDLAEGLAVHKYAQRPECQNRCHSERRPRVMLHATARTNYRRDEAPCKLRALRNSTLFDDLERHLVTAVQNIKHKR